MADVTGPINTLPGATRGVPDGAVCDMHPDRAAVRRVQGETDSYGSEQHDLCQECLDELASHAAEARKGECDWCHEAVTDLGPVRDYQEGTSGPVYQACAECRRTYYRELAEMRDDD